VLFPRARQVLADRAGQEQDHHDRSRDPEWPVEVRVAFEDVEEVLARVERGAAASEDLVGVDVEELLVEGDAPEEALGGGLLAVAWGAEERARVGLDFGGAGGVVVECWCSILAIRVLTVYYDCNCVLELWNSRLSSWRSVWPRSPCFCVSAGFM